VNVLGIDIGGSAIKVAPVNTTTGKLLSESDSTPLPIPSTPNAVAEIIRKYIEHLKWTSPIGVGYPGVIQNGCTHSAAHMGEQWLGFDFLALLHEVTDQPVGLINDADAAGLAEMQFGAGIDRNCDSGGTVLMLTFGTGIGSAFFQNGILFPNTEFGHIETDGTDAENLAAASIRTKLALDWEDWGSRVNRYLNEMEKLVSPDRIIIGGGISENFELFLTYLNVKAELVPAAFCNTAGIIGAAMTAKPCD